MAQQKVSSAVWMHGTRRAPEHGGAKKVIANHTFSHLHKVKNKHHLTVLLLRYNIWLQLWKKMQMWNIHFKPLDYTSWHEGVTIFEEFRKCIVIKFPLEALKTRPIHIAYLKICPRIKQRKQVNLTFMLHKSSVILLSRIFFLNV